MPHGVEITYPQWFFGLVIKENQVTLSVLPGTNILIVLNLNMSFICFDSHRGILTLLIEALQVYGAFFKIRTNTWQR